MSKFMMVAALLTLAACEGKKPETPAVDSAAAAPAMKAPADTMMQHDSTMKADSAKKMAGDTTKKM